jgi:putative membrane protein
MLALVATLLVAAAHVGFMALETFLWTTPKVRKIFGQTAEQAEQTKVLAGNQGVYNGALAACLAWAALAGNTSAQSVLLGFVIVAGLYGAATAKRSILFIQALPAAVALALLLLGL